MTSALNFVLSLAVIIPAIASPAPRHVAEFIPETELFIGLDGAEKVAAGTYAGLANPNYGRLALLYAHQYDGSGDAKPSNSHYHAKGVMVYKGEVSAPTTAPSPASFLPEGSGTLSLLPGTGALSGYSVSGLEKKPLSNLTLRPVAWLNRPKAKEWESLIFKSGPRWTGPLNKAKVALEVVSLTSGLVVLKKDGSVLASSPGAQIEVGTGDFAFTPILGVKKGAKAGPYTAQFRLRDLSGGLKESGVFELRFEVPSP
jgi:hypothetical protein